MFQRYIIIYSSRKTELIQLVFEIKQETKQEIQKLLSKANTETFQIYGENISKDTTEPESSSSSILDDKVKQSQQLFIFKNYLSLFSFISH